MIISSFLYLCLVGVLRGTRRFHRLDQQSIFCLSRWSQCRNQRGSLRCSLFLLYFLRWRYNQHTVRLQHSEAFCKSLKHVCRGGGWLRFMNILHLLPYIACEMGHNHDKNWFDSSSLFGTKHRCSIIRYDEMCQLRIESILAINGY